MMKFDKTAIHDYENDLDLSDYEDKLKTTNQKSSTGKMKNDIVIPEESNDMEDLGDLEEQEDLEDYEDGDDDYEDSEDSVVIDPDVVFKELTGDDTSLNLKVLSF